jgi:hypothetical protein
VLLVIAFAGLLRTAHTMLYGTAPAVADRPGWLRSLPIGFALLLLAITGVAWPPGLAAALHHIARLLGP